MNFFSPSVHKRASRWDANAEGRPIVVTPRDLGFLFALFVHGPLSTAMLRALVAPQVSQWVVTERLKKLKRKPNSLIEQPWQQRASADANYSNYPPPCGGTRSLNPWGAWIGVICSGSAKSN